MIVRIVKHIVMLGIAAGFAVTGALADDGGDGSDGGRTDIRTAINIFQDQKAQFLAQQRDEGKSHARKIRDEVRIQVVAAAKTSSLAGRQELRQAIEDAKRNAQQQARKLVEETTEAARDSRHSRQ